MKKMEYKKKGITAIIFATILIASVFAVTPTAQAASEAEIETAIQNGLVWLADQQNTDGSWGVSDRVGRTGFAVLKMEDRAFELGKDPFDPTYEYSDEIILGLNYIFSKVETSGYHEGAIRDGNWHHCYETGIAMMAISRSGHPNDIAFGTKTYKQVVEDARDYLVAAQIQLGTYEGGWRYKKGETSADNSISGYTTLGLIYAQNEFGVTIPTLTLTKLNTWVDYIQCDADGGSGYTSPCNWENILKTGNLLFQMKMLGDNSADTRVQNAIGYIGSQWNVNNEDPGWRPHHYQSMYTTMKGLEAMEIDTLTVSGNPVDWFDEFSTAIVDSQNLDGSWPTNKYGDPQLSTCWALLTLQKSVEVPATFAVEKSASAYNINSGDSVTYTYLVKNTGIVSISGIMLTDDQLDVIAGPDSGDTNSNGILDPLEVWTYTATTTLTQTTTNTATANGLDPQSDPISTTSNAVTVTVGGVIPEFSTIAIPVASILGLLFFFNYRKRKREQ